MNLKKLIFDFEKIKVDFEKIKDGVPYALTWRNGLRTRIDMGSAEREIWYQAVDKCIDKLNKFKSDCEKLKYQNIIKVFLSEERMKMKGWNEAIKKITGGDK